MPHNGCHFSGRRRGRRGLARLQIAKPGFFGLVLAFVGVESFAQRVEGDDDDDPHQVYDGQSIAIAFELRIGGHPIGEAGHL